MKIDLEESKNKVLNMDCLEFMKQVPDNYFDLVFADPPYGINESGQRNRTRSNLAKANDYGGHIWDTEPWSKHYFNELLRVSKNAIIFGANHFIQNLPYGSSCWIVWDKDNGSTDFADSELAWTNFKTAVRNYKFKWQGMLQQDMANKEKRFHPTQKPVELYKNILRDYAFKYNYTKVYDPCMGSGTTALACKSLALDFWGTELEKDYCEIIEKRLSQVQGSLI